MPLSILEGNEIKVNNPSVFKCTKPVFQDSCFLRKGKRNYFLPNPHKLMNGEAAFNSSIFLKVLHPRVPEARTGRFW